MKGNYESDDAAVTQGNENAYSDFRVRFRVLQFVDKCSGDMKWHSYLGVRIGHLFLLSCAVEIVADLFQVFPRFTFLRRISQEVSRVKCGHDLDSFVILEN